MYRQFPNKYKLKLLARVNRERLGNYTCALPGSQSLIVVDKLPPPPIINLNPPIGSTNLTSQKVMWKASSQVSVIQLLLDFRETTAQREWVSLVIPYTAPHQHYTIRGLSPGTRYQVRLRSRTRLGISSFSTTFNFTTLSLATTARPTLRSSRSTKRPRELMFENTPSTGQAESKLK